MNQKTVLVVTSIHEPNHVLTALADGCSKNGINFLIIGDTASPADFNLAGSDFWDIKRQCSLDFSLAGSLPKLHYARKNLGYLLAMQSGAEIILETDDDNFPLEKFWETRIPVRNANLIKDAGWVNVYRYFSDDNVWPRGFPLEKLKDSIPPLSAFPRLDLRCPIQQGLADDNPDLDAVYRLILPLPVKFTRSATVALGQQTWAPFNSQNTTWFMEAFPLLYLPSFCSFRMTDIWRSFVAQRICWANAWHILFHSPSVRQERNKHDLHKNFMDEIPGYLHNSAICDNFSRLEITDGRENIPDNMRKCYRALVEMGLIDEKELPLLEAWLNDIAALPDRCGNNS